MTVDVTAANSGESGIPDPFAFESESLDGHLGPWRLQLASRYLLISGHMTLSLSIPQPSTSIVLSNIIVDLVQSFELEKDGEIQRPKNSVRIWSLLNHSQGKSISIPPGSSYEYVQQIRLPRDTVHFMLLGSCKGLFVFLCGPDCHANNSLSK